MRAHRFLSRWLVFAATAASVLSASAGSVRVEIKDPKGAAVADAVASLVPLDRTTTVTPPPEPVVVTQSGEEFDPFVSVIAVGTQILFPNEDRVQHHVFSQSKAKKFEIPLYKKGSVEKPILFDQPGVVALGCNIHDWMVAYIVVLDTPHFAKSGADGLVPLAAVPAGRYRLDVWHPRIAAMVSREITVSAEDPATQVISVMLKTDRRIRRAPEGAAGGYK